MKCAHCNHRHTRIVTAEERGHVVTRKRKCAACKRSFTALEMPEELVTAYFMRMEEKHANLS